MVDENEVHQMTSRFKPPMIKQIFNSLSVFFLWRTLSFPVFVDLDIMTSVIVRQEWGEMSSSLAESTSNCRSPRSECRGHGGSPRAAQIEVA